MAFLDEEQDLVAEPVREAPRRREVDPGRKRQQFVFRRLIAVGFGLLLLLLMVLGVRGCLDARKERGIENYVRDVSSIITGSASVGQKFVDAMVTPTGEPSAKDLEGQMIQLRGEAKSLLDRMDGIEAPGELSDPDRALALTLQLRHDALETIGANVTKALGTTETTEAVEAIQRGMDGLYSSDVIYRDIVQTGVAEVIEAEGLSSSGVPKGEAAAFFGAQTTPEEFLGQGKIVELLGQFGGAASTDGRLRGLEISQVLDANGVQLIDSVVNTIPVDSPEITVEILNGGEVDESGIDVTVTVNGNEVTQTVETIPVGSTAQVAIPLGNLEPGVEVSVEVVVASVPGEQIADNNQATFQVVPE